MNFTNSSLDDLLTGLQAHEPIYREALAAQERQWNRDAILRAQREKLQHTMRLAAESVPFYQARFEQAGVTADDIMEAKDLHRLPVLSKQDLRKNFMTMVTRGYSLKQCARNRTSGSTGEPVVNLQDSRLHNEAFSVNAIRLRQAWGEAGFGRMLMVVPRRFQGGAPAYPEFRIDLNGLHKVWMIHPTEQDLDIVEVLNRVQPTSLYGNPYLLLHLANKLSEETRHFAKPRILFSSFELLDPPSRQFLQSVFQCKICDIYGFSEIGDVAWECPHGHGYHINEDNLIVEVLDQEGRSVEDQAGELVVTSLYNDPMPIIRYRVGDVGVLTSEPCPCGRQTKRLTQIKGRNVDFITLPSGERISPYDIMTLLDLPGIARFQVIQETTRHIRVLYVQDCELDVLPSLQQRLARKLGPDVSLEFQRVNAIEVNASDKIRTVLSRVGNRGA